MGWTSHDLPNKKWKLYSRGGTSGVFIKKEGSDEEITIPSKLLRMLVASEVRDEKIRQFGEMDDETILTL
ncbi:MAG: hypothetical protein C4586_08340 [Anaerolineaceae bacterium]|nr:MAG: hypothetical protein C4586_08340 [Anaerolineaceae bacterium]